MNEDKKQDTDFFLKFVDQTDVTFHVPPSERMDEMMKYCFEETEPKEENKNSEDKEKTDEEIEYELGMKVEDEHKDVYELFQKFLKEHDLEMPISYDEYKDMVIKAHSKESPTYYRDLKQYVEK